MAARAAEPIPPSGAARASTTESAPAKINLALHVLGRRSDSYHRLESLVVFADVADALTAAVVDGPVDLTVSGRFAGELESGTPADKNLVLRAARALADRHPDRVPAGAHLVLAKRLPIGAGLGGGSADGAAALRLLNRLWGLDLPIADLAAIGIALGADVPVCLHSRPAAMAGIGEEVKPVAGVPALPMLLVHPGVSVPTGDVFGRLPPAERPGLPPLPSGFASVTDVVDWLKTTRNDLTGPAIALAPPIGAALDMLAADHECRLARMSGSGTSVFGIFLSPEAASRAASRLHAARPHWWFATTLSGAS